MFHARVTLRRHLARADERSVGSYIVHSYAHLCDITPSAEVAFNGSAAGHRGLRWKAPLPLG